MKRAVSILLALIPSIALAGITAETPNDPADLFVSAYLLYQKAERLEMDGSTKAAAEKFDEAGRLLTIIRKKNPDWNPAIVKHRAEKVTQALKRVSSSPQR
jgi:hypothetical protein